jgi:hypothetical protein
VSKPATVPGLVSLFVSFTIYAAGVKTDGTSATTVVLVKLSNVSTSPSRLTVGVLMTPKFAPFTVIWTGLTAVLN